MQSIIINNLKINAYHGVLECEKKTAQPFVISCTIALNSIVANDNLDNTINYVEVCDLIASTTTQNRFNLIETLADTIAQNILSKFKLAKSVFVEIQKPNAPIDHNFGYVATTATRTNATVYLGLGSNLGNRELAINSAVQQLDNVVGISVQKMSTIIESKAYGVTDQPDFLNACVRIKTFLTPLELLDVCKNLEQKAGRQKRKKWHERELDIDILIYEGIELKSEQLTLPHPDMQNRDFVLTPLKEVVE